MTALPLIVGMGGINAAGRTSFHQGFRRIIIDKLDAETRQETFVGLATLMNLLSFHDGKLIDKEGNTVEKKDVEELFGKHIVDGTLIRKIDKNHFDPDATPCHQKMNLTSGEHPISFETRARDLPSPLPRSWQLTKLDDGRVKVDVPDDLGVKHDSHRDNPVKSAGQFPTGFDPAKLYNSRYQPRGLQATIFGVADAIHSTGFTWDEIIGKVMPDQVGTYSASVFGQMQEEGFGGLMKNRLNGERVTAKNLALGMNSMSTDFINAYVTGNVGTTFSTSVASVYTNADGM